MFLHQIRRLATFVLGVFVMSLGIAVAIRADLGTSPIAALPAVLAFASPISVGVYAILLNLAFLAIQPLILRDRFAMFQLIQLPITFAFGLLLDLSVYLTQWITPTSYFEQWGWTLVSVVLMAVGVYVETLPRLAYLPGNGLVVAISMVQSRLSFGTIKILLDALLLALAVGASLLLLGELEGVGEGTIFAAFAVGMLLGLVNLIFQRGPETSA